MRSKDRTCPGCAARELRTHTEFDPETGLHQLRRDYYTVDAFVEGHGSYLCQACLRVFDAHRREMDGLYERAHNKRGERR